MSETTPQEPIDAGGEADSALGLGVPGEVPELVVPEARPEPKRDRWAHRRVEPRGLALAWTLYLLAATIASFGPAAALGVLDPLSGRYAARVLLVLVATGVGLLWPMMRLCQERPARPGAFAVGQDLTVMIIPTQAVVWPLVFLAMWPLSVVAALGAVLFSWTVIFGGLLAFALGPGERGGEAGATGTGARVVWTGICAVVLFAGAILGSFAPGGEAGSSAERWRAMFSPLTAVLDIAGERYASGQAAQVMPEHWAGCGVALGVGLAIWLAVGAYHGGMGVSRGGQDGPGGVRDPIAGEADAGSAR
ncbi:MAG: hypothetical protein AABZ53_13465 [Planctomycetota bacterium]